ncbi:MAG: endolytic transglycosylase MltG, partial [Aggregatilineales bacterium]
MLRFVQFALLLGGLLVACGVIAFGAVFILTGGNLSGGLQTALLRIQLASRQEELNTPAGASTTLVRFTIAPGETPITIARRLEQLGLIRDADLFVSYLRVEGLDTRIQATTYFLNPSQTIPQIATTIIDSRNSSITFRVAEGWRLEEIAAAIDADPRFAFSGDEFLAATADAALLRPDLRQQLQLPLGVTLEGFMAPNTYNLSPDISAAQLRDTFVEAFLDQLQPADLAAINAKGMSIRDIVT